MLKGKLKLIMELLHIHGNQKLSYDRTHCRHVVVQVLTWKWHVTLVRALHGLDIEKAVSTDPAPVPVNQPIILTYMNK